MIVKKMSMTDRNKFGSGIVGIFVSCVAAFMLSSCVVHSEEGIRTQTNDVVMDFSSLTRSAADNTRIYLFNPDEANNGSDDDFVSKVLNINRIDDSNLSATINAGTWDMAFVATEDGVGMNRIIEPEVGYSRAGARMFELKPQGGEYPSAPILLTGELDNQQITANESQEAQVTFSRNVARVMLTLKDPEGLELGSNHKVKLYGFPTTIDWNGNLLPLNNHAVSPLDSDPMVGEFTITDNGGVQKCSTAELIIPANKGTATNKRMKVGVELTTEAGETYETEVPVEIPLTVPANGQLRVELIANLKGELTVDLAYVLPWEEEPTDEELEGDPTIDFTVSETAIEMQSLYDLYITHDLPAVETPTVEFIDPTQNWLSTAWVGYGSKQLQLIGNYLTYDGTPRMTDFWLIFRNFKKRIRVTQIESPEGSIEVTPNPVVLYPQSNLQQTLDVTTTPSGGTWAVLPASWAGGIEGELTNSYFDDHSLSLGILDIFAKQHVTEADKFRFYVNDTFRVINTETLEIEDVLVKNLYMQGIDIRVNSIKDPSRQDTVVYVTPIEVYGGNAGFTVESKPDWILEGPALVQYEGQSMMRIKVARQPDDTMREPGTIVFAHSDEPNYTLPVTVKQDFYTSTPPFDYFVAKFTWPSSDVDIAAEFVNPQDLGGEYLAYYDQSFDYSNVTNTRYKFFDYPYVTGVAHKAVGWHYNYGLGNAVSTLGDRYNGHLDQSIVGDKNSDPLLYWGGDAQQGEGETVFFKAPLITPASPELDDMELPRYLLMDLYAAWYRGTLGNPLRLAFYIYEGGTMLRPTVNNTNNANFPSNVMRIYDTNFYNVGVTDPETGVVTNVPTDVQMREADAYKYLNAPLGGGPISTRTVAVDKKGSAAAASSFRTGYTRIATVIYDRWTHRADIDWYLEDTGDTVIPYRIGVEMITPEEAVEYERDKAMGTK